MRKMGHVAQSEGKRNAHTLSPPWKDLEASSVRKALGWKPPLTHTENEHE